MFLNYYPIDDIIVGNPVPFSEKIKFIRLTVTHFHGRFFVLRGAEVSLGMQLGGTPGQTDGGSLGLVVHFIETVGYDSGHCFFEITEP